MKKAHLAVGFCASLQTPAPCATDPARCSGAQHQYEWRTPTHTLFEPPFDL
jgi:hypothetical protein